jgi:hypothetical protein
MPQILVFKKPARSTARAKGFAAKVFGEKMRKRHRSVDRSSPRSDPVIRLSCRKDMTG